MAIDLRSERLVSFNEAAALLPGNVRPDFSTWWRWTRRGIRGVRLESVSVGRRRFTSVEAVQRFCDGLAGTEAQRPAQARPAPLSDSEKAFLREQGILPKGGAA